MRWLKTIVGQIFGLFVDDGSFAVAIVVWLAFAWLVLPLLGIPSGGDGVILFLGLVVILVESAMRRARQR